MRLIPRPVLALALGMIAAIGATHPAPAQPAEAPASAAPSSDAQASDVRSWPRSTVKLILPLGPGSATDVTARLFAERLAERWGRPVVVENRTGPDGLVAVAAFLGARDDHTLLFSIGGPVTINPASHEKLAYDPDRDLVPIAPASDSFLAIAVSASLGVTSIDELIGRARAEPGKLSWAATPGLPQFIFAGFTKSAGLDMVQVSYRDFSPALQDLAEGRIQVVATGLLPLLPLAQAGKIRLLAVTNRERSPAAPELATAQEIGHRELTADGFQGFSAGATCRMRCASASRRTYARSRPIPRSSRNWRRSARRCGWARRRTSSR